MARASKFVGFVPVGFLAFTAALALVTVLGGWTADTAEATTGYGIAGSVVTAEVGQVSSGYGIDEVGRR
jgi:hypothetical protein